MFPDGKTYNDRSEQQVVILTTVWWLQTLQRLVVNKQRSHRFNMKRFNLKKLNEVEGKEQYSVDVSNRFTAVEELVSEVEINSAWEIVRENIKISAKQSLCYFELEHKPWSDEGCSNCYIKANKPNCSGYVIRAK
jgi:hypothetical protein